nr:L,D-transpeptidase family protein [Mesorhizobium xinjiangense]
MKQCFISVSVLAAALAAGAAPAKAQNLFEMLFGGGARQQHHGANPSERNRFGQQRRAQPQATAAPKPRRPIKKISAPSYYTYRADPLVDVDFASVIDAPKPAGLEPTLAHDGFGEAVGELAGFELAAEKEIAAALRDHYAHNPQFIWVTGTSANSRATKAMRVLSEAASYALDPAEYAVTAPPPGFSMDDMRGRYRALIRFEMTLSARVLRYARDARAGRIDPNRLSGYHDFPKKKLDLTRALASLARTQDVRAYLEGRHPQNAQYQALRVELETLRASEENEIVVDPKLLMRPGSSDADFPNMLKLIVAKSDEAFRAEHGPTIALKADTETYSDDLVPVIKAAQKAHGLNPDGIIGPRTVAALAGRSRADRIHKVEIALEQLRWHPSELGNPYVFINQPAYTASFVEDGKTKIAMRVVVGKTTNQTSFFHDEIERIDYNPYWGVPQSIIVNEMLPRLRRDPGYLDRAGYEVFDRQGRRISSASVNWARYGGKVPFNVRQTPSEANALGELKILFPNKHAIYMHDTPSKSLFSRERRAFSHGCVRLQDPRGMAAAVLDRSRDYVAAKIGKGHSSEKVTRKIPVYVAYFTAWPDDAGSVHYYTDVYGRDDRVMKAMKVTAATRGAAS